MVKIPCKDDVTVSNHEQNQETILIKSRTSAYPKRKSQSQVHTKVLYGQKVNWNKNDKKMK